MMWRFGTRLTCVAILLMAGLPHMPGGAAPAASPVSDTVLLERSLPDSARDMVVGLVEAARREGAPALTIKVRDVTGAEEAVGAGAYTATAIPMGRFSNKVRAADLFSLPFLFNNHNNQAYILASGGTVRQSFDTVTVDFGVRVIALLPVGYQGMAFADGVALHPDDFLGLRVLADGPSERGLIAATSGIPIRAGRHDSTVLAPWEVLAKSPDAYRGYFDLRGAPSLIAVVMNESVWLGLSDDERAAWTAAASVTEAHAQDDLARLHEAELALMRARGVDVVPATARDREIWRAATAGLARASFLGESHKLGRTFLHAVDKIQASPR